MPLFIIEIHWQRRSPQDGQPLTGTDSSATAGHTIAEASRKAVQKFNRHFGMHRKVLRVTEKQEPASLFPEH